TLIAKEVIIPHPSVKFVIIIGTQVSDLEDGDPFRGEVTGEIILRPCCIPVENIVPVATENPVTAALPFHVVTTSQGINVLGVVGSANRAPRRIRAVIQLCP